MAVFTVLERPASGDAGRDAERVRFVPEGFSWMAFLLPLIWILWHRLWIVGIGWLVAVVLLSIGAAQIGGEVPLIVLTGFGLLFAFEANALRRWSLELAGYRFSAIVAGANRDECERRFFAAWLIGRKLDAAAPPTGDLWTPSSIKAAPGAAPAIGLFPSPERPR